MRSESRVFPVFPVFPQAENRIPPRSHGNTCARTREHRRVEVFPSIGRGVPVKPAWCLALGVREHRNTGNTCQSAASGMTLHSDTRLVRTRTAR